MYGYGYRYNSGLVVGAGGGAPFINTYSLDFDGINDYLNLGDSDDFSFGDGATDSPFSISAWIKMDSTSGFRIFNKSLGATSEYQFATSGSGKLQLFIFNSTSNFIYRARVYNTVLNTGQWYHVAATYNGVGGSNAQDGIKIYVDGVRVDDSSVSGGTYVAMGNTTAPVYIGKLDSSYANGSIDEVSVFDTAIDITDVWDGSGKPTDLSDLSPIAWYRMGDNGSYKSPQWLIPNNENKDKVSNYSYQFEGINSRQMTVGTVNVGTTNTTSIWLKRNVVSTQQTLLGGSSLVFPDYYMLLFTANDFYVRYSPTVVIGWQQALVKAIFNNTTDWINIVVVRNGNTVKLHLNGDDAGIAPNFANGGAIGALDTKFTDIGADTGGINPTNGIINNIATWNVDTVLPSDIYNGGTPPDLTTLSTAPVNWWKMGEDATFVYNVGGNGTFTVPDQVGSNDGTSTTVIEDRVGFAPSSENNALSINMDFVDRVLDTPPTP